MTSDCRRQFLHGDPTSRQSRPWVSPAPRPIHNGKMPATDSDWSAKQGRILTADGALTRLYTAERGFPFTQVSE
jgi:hypothetical protein